MFNFEDGRVILCSPGGNAFPGRSREIAQNNSSAASILELTKGPLHAIILSADRKSLWSDRSRCLFTSFTIVVFQVWVLWAS